MATTAISGQEPARRDQLALARTELANERTLLAYSRTAIMLCATGATLFSLYGDRWLPVIAATLLVVSGVLVVWVGVHRFRRLNKLLKQTP